MKKTQELRIAEQWT